MKNLKVEKEFEVEVKRFYFPIQIEVKCPHCETIINRDFSNDYISYPTVNKKEAIALYCEACDEECEIDTTLRISMDVDTENVRKI